ncbi:MAG: DUF1501 domain-containing protein [Isosphaeraceae bacterium]|nr:DUF1501 domain-containing protein [Isosphaeraceae bacterium]
MLWMSGGPSQMDTFDLKPGHENGGPFKAIDTAAAGVKISEHLPKLAREMNDVAVIRSMSTKEGDHGRATFNLRTGYLPQGPIQYPTLGSLVAKELEPDDGELPGFVSIAPYRFVSPGAYAPGFLGPQYAPLVVGEIDIASLQAGTQGYGPNLKVDDLERPEGVSLAQADARLALLDGLEGEFVSRHAGVSAVTHRTAYARAVRMMRSPAVRAFDLEREDPRLRDAYGRSSFGQGCLLARRLVQQGVPFVEVTLSGIPGQPGGLDWDTHQRNFESVRRLSEVLDSAWSTLLRDLRAHGLLDSTLVVWMGEFGRTPKINPQGGRDHFPNAWTTVLSGGGIKGGQFVGRTSADGSKVEERAVTVPDFLATVCQALGIDPRKQNMSDVGRPIRIVDPKAKPIAELLA